MPIRSLPFRILALLALSAGLAAPPALAEDPSMPPSTLVAQEHRAPIHQVLVDLLLVRPIGLPLTAILGGSFWLLGAPVFALTGDMDWWTDACLKEPIRQHIERPLGQL
jgi:hypothetical protein